MNINHFWIRVLSLLICLVRANLLWAQHIEITIQDANTKEGIPFAYVVVIRQNEKFETISNPEGKIKLPIGYDSILTSHVAYESARLKRLPDNTNIILLIPKVMELASITVYGIDLKKEIEYVLKNFSRLYIDNERTYHCTYKETFTVDDSLVRLMQFNLKWWDKAYKMNTRKPYEDQNQVAVEAISYSRALEGKMIHSVALTNQSLFPALHLNYFLMALLIQGQDFTVRAVEKTNTSVKVLFDATMWQGGKVIGNFRNSYFIFDSKTRALLQLRTQLVYSDRVEEVVSRKTPIMTTIKYVSETRIMSFIPEKNKLRLSYFELTGEHEDSVQGNTHFSKNQFRIYVVGTEKGNTIPTASRIRLNETPLFEYVQNTPKKDPTILLTREELEFIQGNDNPYP